MARLLLPSRVTRAPICTVSGYVTGLRYWHEMAARSARIRSFAINAASPNSIAVQDPSGLEPAKVNDVVDVLEGILVAPLHRPAHYD